MHSFFKNTKRTSPDLTTGFTIFEIMIVVVIMMIVVSIIWSSFSRLNKSQVLDKEIRDVASIINDARQRTLFSKNDSSYGIHFANNQVVLFRGTTYSSSDTSNEIKSLNSLVTISNISITGGGSDIIFNRLTGAVTNSGVITFTLNISPGTVKTITIANTGTVEISS